MLDEDFGNYGMVEAMTQRRHIANLGVVVESVVSLRKERLCSATIINATSLP